MGVELVVGARTHEGGLVGGKQKIAKLTDADFDAATALPLWFIIKFKAAAAAAAGSGYSQEEEKKDLPLGSATVFRNSSPRRWLVAATGRAEPKPKIPSPTDITFQARSRENTHTHTHARTPHWRWG